MFSVFQRAHVFACNAVDLPVPALCRVLTRIVRICSYLKGHLEQICAAWAAAWWRWGLTQHRGSSLALSTRGTHILGYRIIHNVHILYGPRYVYTWVDHPTSQFLEDACWDVRFSHSCSILYVCKCMYITSIFNTTIMSVTFFFFWFINKKLLYNIYELPF